MIPSNVKIKRYYTLILDSQTWRYRFWAESVL